MHRILQDALWLIPLSIECAIAVIMYLRSTEREYPLFWSYLVFDILRTAILFSIGNDEKHYATYFYVFWTAEVVACLLGFLVIGEIFDKAFAKRLGLRRYGGVIFRVSFIVLLALAALTAYFSPGNDSDKLVNGIFVLKRAESLVWTGLIGALFFFVFVLGLPWTNYTIGIAVGFGIQGVAEVVVLAIRNRYGRMANHFLIWSLLIAGLCQALVWAMYLLGKQSASVAAGHSEQSANLSTVKTDLDRMNEQVGVLWERRC